jgi:hypothetical protein
MDATFPFEEICNNEDRSWSLRLAGAIANGWLEDLAKIVHALSVLDDPRASIEQNTNHD